MKNINWNDIISIASQSAQPGNLPQQEFINLVQQAKILYTKKRKKKELNSDY